MNFFCQSYIQAYNSFLLLYLGRAACIWEAQKNGYRHRPSSLLAIVALGSLNPFNREDIYWPLGCIFCSMPTSSNEFSFHHTRDSLNFFFFSRVPIMIYWRKRRFMLSLTSISIFLRVNGDDGEWEQWRRRSTTNCTPLWDKNIHKYEAIRAILYLKIILV